MIDRRSFAALVAGVIATPRSAWSQMTSSKAAFYASVGPALTLYQIDVDDSGLTRQGTGPFVSPGVPRCGVADVRLSRAQAPGLSGDPG